MINTNNTSHIHIKMLARHTEKTWHTESKDCFSVRDVRTYELTFMQRVNARKFVGMVTRSCVISELSNPLQNYIHVRMHVIIHAGFIPRDCRPTMYICTGCAWYSHTHTHLPSTDLCLSFSLLSLF
jgi:hypothetical protein